jgi:radical SAM protein with 4Fe4S-binding SPASM domain
MTNDSVCGFHIKTAGGKAEVFEAADGFVPFIVSWNVTLRCNLKCPHCYINAKEKLPEELSTKEAKMLIDQIAEVSRPLLILSGGEPLLRLDLFEIIHYGKTKGFRIGVGSNGTLIDWETARRFKEAGVDTVSISLDSIRPEKHDSFRGVIGSWEKAVNAIKALRASGIVTQVNTTITLENYSEINQILDFCDKLGVENFHLFFLVPIGRGAKMKDISPEMYESIMREIMKNMDRYRLNIKFTCAPQYMRIAHQTGASVRHIRATMRGCIAGLYYCRIYPTGEVTPCPYLPIKLGNIREKSFKEIWLTSKVLEDLRHFERLKGKCGLCEYREVCGGCRARAYGLSSMINTCGGLHEPSALVGDYLAEDPYCCYQPKAKNLQGGITK